MACNRNKPNLQELYISGEALFKKSDTLGAARVYLNILEIDKSHLMANYDMGPCRVSLCFLLIISKFVEILPKASVLNIKTS